MDYLKTSSVNTRDNGRGRYFLDQYLAGITIKPLSYFGDDKNEALDAATEYLAMHPAELVEIPSDWKLSYKYYLKSRTDESIQDAPIGKVNLIAFRDHSPAALEPRYITIDSITDWQVGDIIFNISEESEYKNHGWVCIEAGTPGRWMAFGYNRKSYSDLEIVTELPEADESQEGRLVVYLEESSSSIRCCINTSGSSAVVPTYEWVSISGNNG